MNEMVTTKSRMGLKNKLPPGWRWVRLGDICETGSGGTPTRGNTKFYGGKIPWIKSGELKDGPLWSTEETITEEGLSSSSAKMLPKGTLLIAMYGATVGRLGICQLESATNQAICAIVPGKLIIRDYLFYYLLGIREDLVTASFGGAQPNISQTVIRALSIPLPPLAEQSRITAILQEQLAAVEKARAAAQALLKAAKTLPSAYLREVFPRPGQELSAGWKWVKLGEICEFLDSKRIPVNEDERRQRILGKPLSSLYPYYGANGQVGWIDDYIFDEPLILLAEDGGLFGSLTKSIAYKIVGKSWVNNHAHVLRPKDGIDTDFCLLTLSIRPDIGPMVTGNTRPKLNQEIAAQIQIPLPPLSEQKRIAAILNKQLAVVDIARTTAEAQLCEISTLPSAILRKAFNGEL